MRSFFWVGSLCLALHPARAWSTPAKASDVKEGKITVVRGLDRAEPQLTDKEDKRWLLVGKWREELSQVDGHTVKVWGHRQGQTRLGMHGFAVERYEILDAGGGRRPHTGELRRKDRAARADAVVLEQKRREVPIRAGQALVKRLLRSLNCRVWVVGDLIAGTLKAHKFGVLSCPPGAQANERSERGGTF